MFEGRPSGMQLHGSSLEGSVVPEEVHAYVFERE
jgi:hypothetical protein